MRLSSIFDKKQHVAMGLMVATGLLPLASFATTQGDKDYTFNQGDNQRIVLQALSSSNPPPSVLGFAPNSAGGTYTAIIHYADTFDSNTSTQLVRLTHSGALDTSFNATGQKTVLSSTLYYPTAAAVDRTNDSIVIVGGNQLFSSTMIDVCRYTSSGDLDSTLTGHNGVGCISLPVGIVYGASYVDVTSLAIQPADRKLVLSGSAVFVGSQSTLRVLFALRLGPDGSIDMTFNTHGAAIYSFNLNGGTSTIGSAVTIDPANRIVVVGSAENGSGLNTDVAVVRYYSNGFIDTECGSSNSNCGTSIALDRFGDLADSATAVAIGPTEDVYVAGLSEAGYSDTYHTRLYGTAAVRLSNTFLPYNFPGPNQFVDFVDANTSGYESDVAPSVAVDDRNRAILVTGSANVIAWRLTAGGVSDVSFGTNGRVSVTKPPANGEVGEYPKSQPRVFFDRDKPVIAAITSAVGNPTAVQLSIARLLGDDTIFFDGFEK